MRPMELYPRLLTRQFDRMLEFYTEGLGLVPAKVLPGHYVSFDIGEYSALAIIVQDEIIETIGGTDLPTGATPAADRQMVVFRVAEVDPWTDRLLAHGGTAVTPPTDRPYGLRSSHFRDPDGNLVELQAY